MGYVWSTFKTDVKSLLGPDGNRQGATNFVDLQIRQAVLDIMSAIDRYRTGFTYSFTATSTEVSTKGGATAIRLPDDIDLIDAYLLRTKTPTTNLSGTTTVNASQTVTGVGTKFKTELAIGDYIAVSSAPTVWRAVIEITSETSLRVESPGMGNGSSQTIKKQERIKTPVDWLPWDRREELFTGTICIDQVPVSVVNPQQTHFYLFPPLQLEDVDGYAGTLEVNVEIENTTSLIDTTATPFDEPMMGAVADWVKGECARHVHNDLVAWASFNRPGSGMRDAGGTYWQKKARLFTNDRKRRGFA